MQHAGQVILADLGVVERPAMVLALPDVRPLSADRHSDVHPVAGEPARLRRVLAHPRDQGGHFVPRQQCFQSVDLTVLHRAFREDHHVDGTGLIPGRGERPVGEIEVEPFRGIELEEAEGVVGEPLQRSRYGAEV